jgi:hypothetical protein
MARNEERGLLRYGEVGLPPHQFGHALHKTLVPRLFLRTLLL